MRTKFGVDSLSRFLSFRARTDRHTESQTPLISVHTHRLPTARVKQNMLLDLCGGPLPSYTRVPVGGGGGGPGHLVVYLFIEAAACQRLIKN